MGQNTVNQRRTCLDRKLPQHFLTSFWLSVPDQFFSCEKSARVANFTPSMTQPNMFHTGVFYVAGCYHLVLEVKLASKWCVIELSDIEFYTAIRQHPEIWREKHHCWTNLGKKKSQGWLMNTSPNVTFDSNCYLSLRLLILVKTRFEVKVLAHQLLLWQSNQQFLNVFVNYHFYNTVW